MSALPSCEVLEVDRPDGSELLVPLVRDAIRSIDVEARRIDVDLGFLGEGFGHAAVDRDVRARAALDRDDRVQRHAGAPDHRAPGLDDQPRRGIQVLGSAPTVACA